MVAILQPHIPHYREEFFKGLQTKRPCKIYCYESLSSVNEEKYRNADIKVEGIKSFEIKGVLFYNPGAFLNTKVNTLVLMLHFGHFTTWLLLLTKFLHRKKIILWGHGISVKRYSSESKKPSRLLRWMISMSDTVWLYSPKEKDIWKSVFPKKEIISLNNTISGLETSLNEQKEDKQIVKLKYGISQPRVFIFCARFNTPSRRIDLLLKAIEELDPKTYGFIIIGDGRLKPDFKRFSHVYDFGGLYDATVKSDLFHAADIYFQPGWLGLSVVEGMAYGKPIFTFDRGKDILQGVEFGYIRDGYNGRIFQDFESFMNEVKMISDNHIQELGENSRQFVRQFLTMDHMIKAGSSTLK